MTKSKANLQNKSRANKESITHREHVGNPSRACDKLGVSGVSIL